MRVMRLKEVMDTTGLSRSTVYKYIADGVFPKPVTLGERCVGWVESEVYDWLLARIEERDTAVAATAKTHQVDSVPNA